MTDAEFFLSPEEPVTSPTKATGNVAELIKLSHALGKHPGRVTLWNEGSVALKLSDEEFLVSRRGAHLAKLGEADLVRVDMGRALALTTLDEVSGEAFADAKTHSTSPTASADTLVYAALLSLEGVRFAAHTQPIEVNQILGSPRARQFSDRRTTPSEILACGAASVLVPYADPGLALAKEVRRKVQLWRERYKSVPRLVLLQNQGMIVVSDDVPELLRVTDMTVKSAQIFVGAAMMGGPVFLSPHNVTNVDILREL